MKVVYPNSLKKDKYVTVLASKYFLEYEPYKFTLEQIKAPIKFILGSLEYEVSQCPKKYVLEALVVNKCNLIFCNPSAINTDCLSQCFKTILYYFKGKEPCIRYTVTDRAGVPFPEEHKKEYLEFISIMTKAVVNEVLACTLPCPNTDTNESKNNESPLQHGTVFREINNQKSAQSAQLGETLKS
jgi:hypothetical protein